MSRDRHSKVKLNHFLVVVVLVSEANKLFAFSCRYVRLNFGLVGVLTILLFQLSEFGLVVLGT